MKYDFLIVGAGLFGATIAQQLAANKYTCLIIDRRPHIGGNIYTEIIKDIHVHKYGAHIFHTNNKEVWDYVNSFVEFNRFTNSPVASYQGKLYNLPFNMNTFYQMWGVKTPQEAFEKIEAQKKEAKITDPQNLEEQAISLVGRDIYNTLIKEYTEKQWGRKATLLPSFIIKRLPVRFTFDNNYFNDKYQGIPTEGYTELIKRMTQEVEVRLNTDFFSDRDYFSNLAKKIIFTGEIDAFFNYCYGNLEYRTLDFETNILENISNYQGNAVVNYIDSTIPYTRIIEHKHFNFGQQKDTIITKEFPKEWKLGDEPYYPINDSKNTDLYNKYQALAKEQTNVIFGGRLAEYRYYDMHQVIEKALQLAKEIQTR